MNILSGLEVRDFIKEKLKKQFSQIGFKPKLSILLVSSRSDSVLYVKNKQKFGEDIGVLVEVINFREDVSESVLISEIDRLNRDVSVNAIIVQLPLPGHIDKENVLNRIDISKDVDGLTVANQNNLYSNKPAILPATARAVISIFNFYKIEIKNKNIAIFGKSSLVGKPTAFYLQKLGASISVIDSKTEDPQKLSKKADIIVVAIGKPLYINSSFIGNNKPVIVDVGINQKNSALCGDVDFEDVKSLVSAITPVPKGVGPVTVASIFENLLEICYNPNIKS